MMKRQSFAARTRWWMAAAILLATSAIARPYGVEDMLTTETLDQVRISPGGKWLVFEREIPRSQADRFDFSTMAIRRTRLFRVDLAHPGAAAPLLDAKDEAGTVMLGFSPHGGRLAVARLDGWHWRLGVVTLSDGAVRWFDTAPSYFPGWSTLAWISEDRLVALAQADDLLPWKLRQTRQDEEDVARSWDDFARGDTATVTAIGSGPLLDDRPSPATRRLVDIDVVSGHQRALGEGDYESLSLSPDHRHLALSLLGAMNHPPTGPISQTFDPRRRSLLILDLATGRSAAACAGCDLPFGSRSWSRDGSRLLFFARAPGQRWEDGSPWVVRNDGALAQPLSLGGLHPAIMRSPGEYDSVGLGWQRDTPLIFARRSEGENPAGWFALGGPEPHRLTTGMVSPAPTLLTDARGGAIVQDGTAAWRLGENRPHTLFTGVDGITALSGEDGGGLACWRRTPRGLTILLRGAPRRAMQLHVEGPGEPVFHDANVEAGAAAVTMRHADGTQELLLVRAGRPPIVMAQVNRFLANVPAPRMIPVRYRLPGGEAVTSWLYLPPDQVAPPPLVVVPYPGRVFGATPPGIWNPGLGSPLTSVPTLVGHGYAVLLPSMPILPPSDAHPFDFAGQVLAAVDAVGATGLADTDRLGLWGHSYGGYTAATIATETDRFRAIVASNGAYDLASFQSQFALSEQRHPGEGQGILFWAGWAETGQPHLGGSPSEFPARYIMNSPVYHVGNIHTPILLVGTDRDIKPIGQTEEMFSALYRADKEARLLSYWGEDHVNLSPANVRDLYARVFAWFDGHLGGAAPSGGRTMP
jgi:dipeptidyl aminopeptidase/acylaminoacyl peptidase